MLTKGVSFQEMEEQLVNLLKHFRSLISNQLQAIITALDAITSSIWKKSMMKQSSYLTHPINFYTNELAELPRLVSSKRNARMK